MAEEEVSYASVVIKSKKEPQTKSTKEEQNVYDEVKIHNKTVQPTADTIDSAEILSEKKAGRRRCFQLLACLGTICVISMLGVIGVIIDQNQNLTKQNQELHSQKNNLTDQIQKMEKSWVELNVSRAQWSIDAYCPKTNVRTCAACQQGWSVSQSSCYAYNDAEPSNQLSWEEARENCRGKISDLTVVTDETEKKHVNDISGKKQGVTGYWIGLRAVEGKWKWIDGSDLTNNTWIDPPTNNSQCVISVQNQRWKPVSCENKNGWICEKKALFV